MNRGPQKFDTRQHMLRNDFEAFYYSDDDMHGVAPHRHGFYEMLFFLEGDVTYMIDGTPYPLLPGDLLIVPSNTSHYPVFGGTKRYRRVVLWLTEDFVRSLEEGETLLDCLPPPDSSGYFFRFPSADGNRLLERAVALAEEFSYDRPFGGTMATLLANELLIQIHRLRLSALQGRETDSASEHLVKDVVRFINENLARELTLDYIADHFFISKFYLSRVFKRYMDITPHNYITQRRLALAKQLLFDGMSPTEIHRRCGYADYSSFYRAFREHYGFSPKHLCFRDET